LLQKIIAQFLENYPTMIISKTNNILI